MNFYLVSFPGAYLQGNAVVAADTEDEARRLVQVALRKRVPTWTLDDDCGILQIPVPGPCVMFLSDGDY